MLICPDLASAGSPPRQDVFEFLDDDDNLKKIVPNLIEAGIIQETPERVGTTFWHVYEDSRLRQVGKERFEDRGHVLG